MKTIILVVLFTVLCSLFTIQSFAQGIVRGKIADGNGETLIGVILVLKTNRTLGTTTDIDGSYSLSILDTNVQTIHISYVGYTPIELNVHPRHGEVIIKNFVLTPVSNALKEVEITAKAVRANDNYMEKIKTKSATTIDYISAETMKKTGDANVTSAVTRVSGVSTNGAFITVRGIGDRYIKTTINDCRIPTLDPFTNNIKLDMFPAALVDNIVITKTASPDLSGDWAGAYISIQTKEYPDKLSVNVETSVGYNNQTTFKDVISSQHSSTDWLGYDNGFREHSHTGFNSANMNPSQFQELVALGLGDYYKSLGISNNPNSWNENYFKLGLVQLGLLAPALINDATAVKNAENQITDTNGKYYKEAFDVINAGAAKTGQSLPDNWNTTARKAPLDFSQSFSIGNQTTLFGKPLGFLAGFRYGSSMQYDPNSIAQRIQAGTDRLDNIVYQKVSKETNAWSALMNLAYKFDSNNSISLMFMPNFSGANNVKNSQSDNGSGISQFYEERKQLVYQLKSEHYIPGPKLKINLDASFTNGKSSAPDFKNLQYTGTAGNNGSFSLIDPNTFPADRYFRYLADNLFDSHVSAELPLDDKIGLIRKIKFGGAYQYDKQKNDQYWYHIVRGNSQTNLHANSLEQLMGLDNFGITDNVMNWYYHEDLSPVNHTFGRSHILAGFIMLDYSIIPSLRFSGGLRFEKSYTYTDINDFNTFGYQPYDERRFIPTPFASYSNPGNLNNLSYLPSANLIYKLKNDEAAPINLRFNYSQTVARPSIRELTDVSVFDYELQAPVTGNSTLKIVQIYNYDLRLESYFRNKDNISISVFYKNFKNHIELEYSDSYYWQNVDKSYAKGIELEGKKTITKHFDLSANVTLVSSNSTFFRSNKVLGYYVINYNDKVSRPMFGQAPYIINGILSYSADSIGLMAAITYNVQGPRLVIGSNNNSIPDIYELPRNLLDFKLTKSLGKHFSISMKIRDILNAPVRRTYKYPQGYIIDYDKYRYGTNYILSMSYKI